jgi:hypothetical protein
MSVSLIVLLPVVLLGIVSLFCFVGCVLDTSGLPGGPPSAFTQYSSTTVLGNPAIAAYWPLSEANDTLSAADLAPNPDSGQYIDPSTLPAIYPWPDYSIGNSPSPDIESATAGFGTKADAGFGTIVFAQPGIVPGDFGTGDSNAATGCLVVNGCYVEVPLVSKINPPTSFTLEAWVRVDWSKGDPHAWRAVLDARDINPGTGFAIIATADDNGPDYHWTAFVGNGGADAAAFTTVTSNDPPITLNDPSTPGGGTIVYLAVSYDGPTQTLTIFVDGAPRGSVMSPAVYVPNTTRPLWIGAGVHYVPKRPQAANVTAGPLLPFVGALQDIAIYSKALTPGDILMHFHNGKGSAS